MVKLAPIVLFVYNRPDHTRQTLEALAANFLASDSELFIYSDAPKNQDAIESVQSVRFHIKNIQGFKSVTIIERETNWGIFNSVIDGVTNIVSRYNKVIVLEDDIVTSSYFLTYMNDTLNLYENNEQVASIHGYIYPVKKKLSDYFFLRGADCWGWATWKRSWDIFNIDAQFLLDEIKRQRLEKLFNFNNSYNYTGMLKDEIDSKDRNWDICWYASAFLADKYTLYPGKSFVKNIGIDGSGTHCGISDGYNSEIDDTYKPISYMKVLDCKKARKAVTQFYKHAQENNILLRYFHRIKLIFKYK